MNLLIMIKNFHHVRPVKTKSCLQTSDFPKKTLNTAVKRTFANLALNVLTVARTSRPSLVTWDSVATVLEGKQAWCVTQSCRLPSWRLTLFTPKNRLVSAITSSATCNKLSHRTRSQSGLRRSAAELCALQTLYTFENSITLATSQNVFTVNAFKDEKWKMLWTILFSDQKRWN